MVNRGVNKIHMFHEKECVYMIKEEKKRENVYLWEERERM